METAEKDPEASCREIRDFLAVRPEVVGSGAQGTPKQLVVPPHLPFHCGLTTGCCIEPGCSWLYRVVPRNSMQHLFVLRFFDALGN